MHAESLPVSGTSFANLDRSRIEFYLQHILRDPEFTPYAHSSIPQELLINHLIGMGFLTEGSGRTNCTIVGLLLFGVSPRRFLGQAGLRVMVFAGIDKEYAAKLDVVLDGPLVGRKQVNERGEVELVDGGLIERFSETILPFISIEESEIDQQMRRGKRWIFPFDAVREAIINALAHRDWTRSVDIEVTVYGDRMEVISPGKLQNCMTIKKIIAGQRSPRNPLIVETLRDYAYVDERGMGVRTKIIPLMRTQNGKEPIFEETDDYLKIVLPVGNSHEQEY